MIRHICIGGVCFILLLLKLKKTNVMKIILTLFFSVCTLALSAQQVQREKVIVEIGTGTWCPSCPAVVDIIHDFIDEGLEIAVVEYHVNDPYQNAESLARRDYYDFPWYPTTYYDSDHIGFDDWATTSVHRAYYENRLSTLSSFNASIDMDSGALDGNTIQGTINLEKVADYQSDYISLHIVLTESNIPENWQGETELDYTERAMFPNAQGTVIDFNDSDTHSVDFAIDMDPSWVMENCEIVYFLQDNETKEVLQGDNITIEEFILSNGDFTQTKEASFYPNPVSDEFYIRSQSPQDISSIEIYNVLGKKVMAVDQYQGVLSIAHLPQGMYLLSFIENDTKKVGKLIKQ